MLNFIVTYDLADTDPSPYDHFKTVALKYKWFCNILASGGRIADLPNTTLNGKFNSIEEAEMAFFDTIRQTRSELGTLKVNSLIIVEVADFSGVSKNVREIGQGFAGPSPLALALARRQP